MSNSGRYSITLSAANANNIVMLLDFTQILSQYESFKIDDIVEHTIAIEDLHARVGLFSLLEASWPNTTALASEAEQEAARAKILKEGQKVYLELYIAQGNGPWKLEAEEVLQNKNGLEQPWSLMGLIGSNLTALLGEDIKLGFKIASRAQGIGGLKGSDYVRISGTWRKNTNIEPKKKEDGIEALHDRIGVLELALKQLTAVPKNSFLGRGESAQEIGLVEQLSRQSALSLLAPTFENISGIVPISKGGTGIGTPHSFRAGAAQIQSIPASAVNTFVKVVMDSEVIDTNNQYTPALSRLTAITTEIWQITVHVKMDLTVDTRVLFSVFKNGAEVAAISRLCDVVATPRFFSVRASIFEFPLVAGDYLETMVLVNGACTTSADGALSAVFWSGKRIA